MLLCNKDFGQRCISFWTDCDGPSQTSTWKTCLGLARRLALLRFLCVLAEVAVEAWEMMDEQKCLPSDPSFLHYLWVLAFMRMYPANDEALSRVLGGSDPKTIHKYMWPYNDSIFELDEVLVSRLLCIIVE